MPRHPQQEKMRMLSKVGSLYYDQGLTQQEISDKLGISRPMVSRLIKQARQEGIVQINVLPPAGVFSDLEYELEQKYGLKEAIVVDVDPPYTQSLVSRQLGIAAADYFYRTMRDGDVIGLTWGTTLHYMAAAMHPVESRDMHIAQILGGLGPPESEVHANSICSRMAQMLSCKFTIIPSPGIVRSMESKGAFLADGYVKNALEMIKKVNVAYIGIGAPTPTSVVMKDGSIISQEELDDLLRKGAVGDIGLRYFDIMGNPIQSDIDERVIGVTLAQIKKIKRVVGIAGGPEKYEALLGGLRGGYLNVLITEQVLAKKLVR
jgi:DNA-binding transcriptional regulator LsrR (DeoR family)